MVCKVIERFTSLTLCAALLASGTIAQTQQQGTPVQTTTPPVVAPVGTQQTGTQTPTNPNAPAQTQLPPNAGTATVNPQTEAQQSVQPQTGLQQQQQQTSPTQNQPRPVTPTITPTTPGQTGTGATGTQGTGATGTGATGTQGTTTGGGATTGVGQGATGAGVGQGAAGQNVGGSSIISPAQLPTEPPAIAPGYEAPLRPLPSAERIGVDVGEQTPLTLNDAIALALQNNNDLDAARIDVRLAEFDLTAANGIYEPRLTSENYYERRVTPVSSIFAGGTNGSVTQQDATGSLRFGGVSPYFGGAYQVDFSSTRLQTDNATATLNPQFPSAATVTYVQPLLRGFRIDDNRRRIQIARKNLSLSDSQFRGRAIEVITQVEQSYWDLAFALRNLQVQIEAVKQARTQVESNRRLVQQGVLAPIDLVAADAQVTNFEQNIYAAQELVTRSENNLKSRILADRTNGLWSRALVPVTDVDLTPPTIALTDAVQGAIENRPELAQLQTSAEINGINTRFFRDQTRPQIDLVGTFSPVGLAGAPRIADNILGNTNSDDDLRTRINLLSQRIDPTLPNLEAPATVVRRAPENLIGGYGQSLGNLFGFDYPAFRVGVRLSIPLRNRTAKANLGRSLAEGTRIENQRAQLEQLVESDVRNSLQTVRSTEARLASAASARNSAELQYASEQRQFAAGTSTVFLVLQRQQELVAARGRELQTQIDLNKAIADLQRATGRTLAANNVSISNDKEFREIKMNSRHDTDVSQQLLRGNVPRTFSFNLKQQPSAP